MMNNIDGSSVLSESFSSDYNKWNGLLSIINDGIRDEINAVSIFNRSFKDDLFTYNEMCTTILHFYSQCDHGGNMNTLSAVVINHKIREIIYNILLNIK